MMYWIKEYASDNSAVWLSDDPGTEFLALDCEVVRDFWVALEVHLSRTVYAGDGRPAGERLVNLTLKRAREFLRRTHAREGEESPCNLEGLADLVGLFPELAADVTSGVDWRPGETLPEDYYAL